jgi:hypothetical protein
MAQPVSDDDMEEADARQAAARPLRPRRRADLPLTAIKKGRQWEVAEPADYCMVPHGCGVLILREPGVGVPP